jgi:2,3-bisphosphoglycerate-dependent phosphoglycerate mutase
VSYKNNKIVLLRHAQSQWNLENRFTGWTDVGLSERGEQEARKAGIALADAGFRFDEAHASVLCRAVDTWRIVVPELGPSNMPLLTTWRLNERHYGALQGLNKTETADRYSDGQVYRWRRGYADRPPALDFDDPRHPRFDRRYADLPFELLPATESLEDVLHRVLPYWRHTLHPLVLLRKQLLVVAHGNTLRALVMHLEGLDAEQVESLEVPTGRPLVYRFDRSGEVTDRYYLGDARPAPPGPGSSVNSSAA